MISTAIRRAAVIDLTQAILRTVGIYIVFVAILMFVVMVPNELFVRIMVASAAKPVHATRGGTLLESPESQYSRDRNETDRRLTTAEAEIVDVGRRLDQVEHGQFASRIAVIESRMETMFELGRIVLGAAVLYLFQAFGQAITWIVKKQKAIG